MGLGSRLLLVGLGFAAGIAVGALTWRGPSSSVGGPDADRPGAAYGRSEADPAAPPASAAAPARDDSPAGTESVGPAAAPSLAAPLADPERHLRGLVAEAARKELGESLPAEALEEAVRRARASYASTPAAYAHQAVERERARRVLGDLGDPWEMVVEVRTSSSLRYDLSDAARERPRVVPATAPLDVTRPVETARREPDAVFVRAGVPPVGTVVVLESVEVSGAFGLGAGSRGEVEVEFGGVTLPKVFGTGTTEVRFAGSHTEWWWADHDGGDLQVSVERAAARVVLRGRLVARDANPRPVERGFRMQAADGGGYVARGPVRIQIVADHGGGNPRTIGFDGAQNGRVDVVSDRPVWDDALVLKDARRSSGFVSGAGWIPPGKAFRVRRIEWRARFGEVRSHGELVVRVGGTDVVAVRAKEIEEERRRAGARGADLDREELRSGVWTGEALVRAGEEERTSLTCAYYVMGEAIFDGEVVEDPK